MKYRPEIDGLRALAVVPVILFHAGFELFSGGFVGVDIFFVISGYLITTILIDDFESNQFSISNFYERRARRILPALFLIMLVCLPFAWMWLLPTQMMGFSQSLIAVSLFVSNIFFWRETGYFSEASPEKPLLNTWSLAVEEQYYILFPIFLLLAWRFGKNRVFWMIVIMAAISLALSEWGWRNKPIANFYLAPARAWEIFAGSIAAFIVKKWGVQSSNLLSLLGLVLILFAIFVFDEFIPIPSLYALVPVLGVVLLVLFADTQTFVAKFLSTRVLVGIGLISYSAYLWHQPIIAFGKIYTQEDISISHQWAFVVLTGILAVLSWKFIEIPFRRKDKIGSKAIWIFAGLGCSFFIIVGLFGLFGGIQKAIGYRLFINDAKVHREFAEAVLDELNFVGYLVPKNSSSADHGYIRFGGANSNKVVTFIGDSHSDQYRIAIGEGLEKEPSRFEKTAIYFKNFDFLPSYKNLNLPKNTKTVVLSYFWSLRYRSPTVNNYIRCCGNGPGGVIGKNYVPFTFEEMEKIDARLLQLISKLQEAGISVIIVLDNPFGEELNARSLVEIQRSNAVYLEFDERALIDLRRLDAIQRSEPARSRLVKIGRKMDIKLIDPIAHLCDDAVCPKYSQQGYLLYQDYDHLSVQALKNNADYIFEVMD